MTQGELAIGIKAILTDWTQPINQAKADLKGIGPVAEEAHGRAGDAAAKHGKQVENLAQGVTKFGQEYRMATAGLDVFGLHADAAGAKVAALVDVIGSLGKAAPELLAIGGIVALGAAAFEGLSHIVTGFLGTLKDSVLEAGHTQLAMAELKAITEDQGQSWKVAGKEIGAWLDKAAGVSGFTRGELADGLRQLAAAGKFGADGITYQRVAMELARATGISLSESEDQLTRASYDMGRGLIALGVLRKEDIKDGMTQAQMLDAVHDRVKGAAEAYGTTLPGAIARVNAEWKDFLDALGTPFLNAIAMALNVASSFVVNLRTNFEKAAVAAKKFAADNNSALSVVAVGFRLLFDSMYGIVVAGWTVIQGAFRIALDVLHGDLGKAFRDMGSTIDLALAGFLRSFGVWGENMVTMAIFIADRITAALSGVARIGFKVVTGDYLGALKDALTTASSEAAAIRRGPMLKTAASPLQGDAWSSSVSAVSSFTAQLKDLFKQQPTLQHDQPIDQRDAKDTSAHDAEEALKKVEQRIKDWLDTFDVAASSAEDSVKRAQRALDQYKGSLPDGKPQNVAQGAHLKELEDAVASAQMRVAAAANNRAIAETHAADVLRKYASTIDGTLANADDLRRAAAEAAAEHKRASRADVDARDTARAAAQKTTNAGVGDLLGGFTAAGDALVEADRAGLASKTDNTDLQIAQKQNAAAKVVQSPEDSAALDLEIARLRDNLAIDAEGLARHTAKVEADNAAVQKTNEARKKADDAAAAALKATTARINADTALINAENKLTQLHNQLGESLVQLIDKLRIPGLSAQQDKSGNLTTSLNPMALLFGAFEQTKSFADIMKIVNELMKTFSELLNILEPIINSLLQVLAFVANIFIDLYDTIAQLLRLLGIHVQLLDRINADFNAIDSSPFMSIVHDIPTMNELTTGKTGTLSPTPTNYSNFAAVQQPTIDAINSPPLGGGLLSVLGEILEAVLALKVIMALFGGGSGGGGLFGFLGNIFGSNGPLGFLSKLFGGGGGSGSFSIGGLPGALMDPGGGFMGPNLMPSVVQLSDDTGQLISSTNPLNVLPTLTGTDSVAATTDAASALDTLPTIADAAAPGATSGASIASGASGLGLGTIMQGIGIGLLGGDLGAKVTGGDTENGMIGGLVGAAGAAAITGSIMAGVGFSGGIGGGLAALMAAGPAGWGILLGSALLGGALGGMFGPKLNAQNDPDIFEPQQLSQGLANVGGGPFTANGTTNTENPQIAAELGGQTEGGFIASFIAQNPQLAASTLTPQELQFFTSAQGNYGQNYEKGGNVENVTNDQTLYWSQLVSDATDAINKIFTALSGGLASTAQNITNSISAAGNQLVGTIAASTTAAANATRSDLAGPTSVTVGDTNINQNITHTGDINGPTDLDDLEQMHGNAAQRAMSARVYSFGRYALT